MAAVRMAKDANPAIGRLGYKAWLRKLLDSRGWSNVYVDLHRPTGGEIEARVVKACWVVFCPNCNTPILVDETEPVFFCPDCHSADIARGNDYRARRVVFAHKGEIEQLFARRIDPRTRNWLPNETLSDLRREQIQHAEL